LTSVDGVSFDYAWGSRIQIEYGPHAVHVISLDRLIQNKRASGRPQDLADVDMLERHRR
jgi:hypothetical protein